jgi:DNA repair protein SbcC/Rad50
MILRQIRLHPFGGAADRPVAFARGLNVVLGPNEAGKSTLVNALRSVLFRTTQLSATKFRTEMQTYVPVTGGDTVRVTLLFGVGDQDYTLEKCWGASRASRLCLPGGGELTGPDKVEKELEGLLGLGEGTYNYVLITYQAHLAGTVEELRKNPLESTVALTSLLQRSIFQSDGVSIERLRTLARERVDKYFGRWDRKKAAPENGRDIDNPWQVGVGTILECWYKLRATEESCRVAVEYEKGIDEFAARMKVLQEDVDSDAVYISAQAPFVVDARKRSELESRLEKVNSEIPKLRDVQQQWPRSEEQMRRLRDEVIALREQYRALQLEQRQTEEYLSQQALRETFAKAERENERLTEEEHRLATLRNVSDRDLKALKDVEASINGLRIKLESQKLALRIDAKVALSARLRTAAGEKEVSLRAGESASETTKGSFELSHADWSFGVRSATDDALALQEGLEGQLARHAELCRTLGVSSPEEATVLQRSYEEQRTRVEKAKSALQALLGKESYEALAQRTRDLGTVSPGRTVSAISELMKHVTSEGANKSRDEKDLQRQCNEWAERYTDHERLLDLLVRFKQDAAELKHQVDALAPLPAGQRDAAAYVADYDRRKDDLATKKEKLNRLMLERAAFEKNEPEDSQEELEGKLVDLRASYEAACAEGDAYSRIHDELEKLVGTLDAKTYRPLQDRYEQLVDRLTLRRYGRLQMEGLLPVKITGTDRAFALNMLSQGTLDALALAVRIGMAEYYLEGGDGFILMDDPLVNLDPERKKAAVGCLQDFAGRKQAIILTCHPDHANLLGGNLIRL